MIHPLSFLFGDVVISVAVADSFKVPISPVLGDACGLQIDNL